MDDFYIFFATKRQHVCCPKIPKGIMKYVTSRLFHFHDMTWLWLLSLEALHLAYLMRHLIICYYVLHSLLISKEYNILRWWQRKKSMHIDSTYLYGPMKWTCLQKRAFLFVALKACQRSFLGVLINKDNLFLTKCFLKNSC